MTTSDPQPHETDPASRRQFQRWQFHGIDVPLALQSEGLAARVYRPGLLFDSLIGQVVVKDLSLGGAGLLVSSRYALSGKVLLAICDCKPLPCQIVHQYAVAASLNFVGVSWRGVKPEQVLHTVGAAVRHFERTRNR